MSDRPVQLVNGEIWQQTQFPNMKCMVLMLGHVGPNLTWCKVGVDVDNSPIVMSEENGRFMWHTQDLLDQLQARGYSPAGFGRVHRHDEVALLRQRISELERERD